MTEKQRSQAKSWFVYIVAIAVAYLSSPELGLIVIFGTSSIRAGLSEKEFSRKFIKRHKLLVACFGLLTFISIGILFYENFNFDQYQNNEFSDYIKPLYWILPILAVYEYELFKVNAEPEDGD